jgi:hypothetical protein
VSETQDHLRIRIPEKGELTLSMPDGVLRALRDQRLPSFAEVWHDKRQQWVSLASHPGVLGLLQSISAHSATQDQTPAVRIAAPVRVSKPHPAQPFIVVDPAPARTASVSDDVPELVLDELADPLPSAAELLGEPVQPEAPPPPAMVAPSQVTAESPPVSPPLAEVRAREPVSVAVAVETPETAVVLDKAGVVTPGEILALEGPSQTPADPPLAPVFRTAGVRRRSPLARFIPAVAGILVVTLAAGGGAWWYRHSRPGATSDSGFNSQAPVVPGVIPAGRSPSIDTLGSAADERSPHDVTIPDLPLQGVSGAGPEPELETSLRLAHAERWNPAEDFGSTAALQLARHKVEAARNCVIAYRIDMQRLPVSARLAMAYDRVRVPFDEAVKIDSVLGTMQTSILLLDSLQGRFRVDGPILHFARPADANRWNALRLRADSILGAPVELDSYPGTVRPPRRAITRLVRSLPPGQ